MKDLKGCLYYISIGKIIFVFLLIFLFVFNAIMKDRNEARKEARKIVFVIDIKTIAGKTLKEVEAVLGKSEGNLTIDGYPCKNSNCEKHYFQQQKYEIIFKNGKSDWINIYEPDLFSLVSIGLYEKEPDFQSKFIKKWSMRQGTEEISFFEDYILVKMSRPDPD